MLPWAFNLGWLRNESYLYRHVRGGLRMKDDDVRCSPQTSQHVLFSHFFRDIRFNARIHQIELVVVREHLKFMRVFHAAKREGEEQRVGLTGTVPQRRSSASVIKLFGIYKVLQCRYLLRM